MKKQKIKVSQFDYLLTPKKDFFKTLEVMTLLVAILFVWSAKDDPNNYQWFCVHALICGACVLLINLVGVCYTRYQYNKRRIKRSDVLDPLL